MRKERVPRKIKKAAKMVAWDFEYRFISYELYAAVNGRNIKHIPKVLANLKIAAHQYEMGINGRAVHLTRFNPALRYCKCYILLNDKEKWKEYLEKRKRL